jgi:transcriptional regulator with XRE-family HTH domain
MRNEYRRRDVARAFGSVLRQARRERGMSQDKLSEVCNFDRTYPSLLERGLRCPTLTMLLRLADALAVEPARLVVETVKRLQAT